MRLRLFHADDGARIAYREAGTGPGLVLVHSASLSHRELEPAVEHLAHRYRVVLPDLPLHGDSEDRPRHPYTFDWMAQVLAAFCTEVAGPRPLVGGHAFGADLLLRAVELGASYAAAAGAPVRRLHRPPEQPRRRGAWRVERGWRASRASTGSPATPPGRSCVPAGARDGADRARRAPRRADLVRHAMADVGGNANLARSWARLARELPTGRRAARCWTCCPAARRARCCCSWADEDRARIRCAARRRRWTCCQTRSLRDPAGDRAT